MAQFIPFIAAAASAVGTIAETAQARKVGETQARGLEEQARAASLEAGAAEEAQRRQARAAFGETRAAGAQMGLLESASFADAYSQAATMAELDALNIRSAGESRRKGLMYESAVTRAARPKWGPAILSAGTKALTSFVGTGGTLPGG
jgi:phosphoribosylanthranilate isomerase